MAEKIIISYPLNKYSVEVRTSKALYQGLFTSIRFGRQNKHDIEQVMLTLGNAEMLQCEGKTSKKPDKLGSFSLYWSAIESITIAGLDENPANLALYGAVVAWINQQQN